MPIKLFSVGHQPYRASKADNTTQHNSLHQVSDANQRFPLEQSNLISSQPIVSAPLVQQFLTPHNLVGSVFRQKQTAQASLHSVQASCPIAPSPYTPATTSLAFPVQPNSNIYTTAQPVSQPEMLISHWRSHPPPQNVSNACIKLPPIQITKFDGDPLAFQDWINIFKASVHENTSKPQTRRITYLQNSVNGKAKDVFRGYSCNPALYHVALAELKSRVGAPQYIVTAYIHRLENWAHISSQNPQTLVSFFTFLQQLVQTFINLRFTVDLQSSTVLTIAKKKLPHNLLLKWTEHIVRNNILSQTLLDFQQWLEIQARVLEAVEPNLPRPNKPSHRDHRLPRKRHKRNKMNVLSVTNIIRSLAVRNISTLSSKIEYSKFKVCISVSTASVSAIWKKTAPRPTAASNPTAVLCTTRPSTPLIPKTDAPNEKDLSEQTTSCSSIHESSRKPPRRHKCSPSNSPKSSHNNSSQHQFNPSQFNDTARSVDPENKEFPRTLFALLQIIPVSLFNGDKVFDTYALLDPGSTGTYVLDSISHPLDLETGHQLDLDVQYMNLSRSFSVRPTAFKMAPYALRR